MPGLTHAYHSLNGRLIGETNLSTGVKTHYVTDALGSVSPMTSTSYHQCRYKPYGATLFGTPGTFGWCGAWGYSKTDRSVSTHYVRARHYSTVNRLWTTVDPLWPNEAAQVYVNASPTNGIDYTGFEPAPCRFCVCCPTRISLEDLEFSTGDYYNRVGCFHTFNVKMELDWRYALVMRHKPCRLEWWEKTDLPNEGNPVKNVWVDQVGNQPYHRMWSDFDRKMFLPPCPGRSIALVNDQPGILGPGVPGIIGNERKRRLCIKIVIHPGSEEVCAKRVFFIYQELRWKKRGSGYEYDCVTKELKGYSAGDPKLPSYCRT